MFKSGPKWTNKDDVRCTIVLCESFTALRAAAGAGKALMNASFLPGLSMNSVGLSVPVLDSLMEKEKTGSLVC